MVIAIIVLASLIFLLIAASAVSMDIAIVRRKHPVKVHTKMGDEGSVDTVFKSSIEEGMKWIGSLPFTEHEITAFDGTPLYARFYRNGDSKTTILMMHGFRSNPIHDFSCAFKFYYDKGFNLLVPDQRAHGKSGGKYITYGAKERYDAKSWLEYANTLVEGGELYATGVSMGATTVLMAAELPLPEEDYYEGYRQLENGVGMLRSLEADFMTALEDEELPESPTPFTIATGTAAAAHLRMLLQRAQERFPGLQGQVIAVENDFFGHTIDVAGLLTGQDIAAQLKGKVEGRVLIPLHMLRHGETVFLDDYTVERLSDELGVPVQVVGIDGGDLADAMFETTY